MTNTSATGGYLVPTEPPAPIEDDSLDDFLQAMVVAVAGLQATMVRPRWQPIPPKQPPATADWAAIGVTARTPDANAVIVHHPDGDGYDALQRHETLTILVTFYGPHCHQYAGRLRDGLSIAQNREAMQLLNMGVTGLGDIVSAPELVNQQWIRRADLTFQLRRQIDRNYPVKNLLSAHGTLQADDHSQTWNAE